MATTMVAQHHHAPPAAAAGSPADQHHDDDDVFDRVFTSFEATVLPYILTEDSHAFLEDDGAPILDYVCENVEQFTCRDDAPHLLLEEQVANALGVVGVVASSDRDDDTDLQNHQYSIDRDNSLIEHDSSATDGTPIMMPTSSKPVKYSSSNSSSNGSTSSARAARGFRAKSRIKIQPCGAEGDVLDYVFEETERHTCGAGTGSPSTTATRDVSLAAPAAAKVEQEEDENQQGGGGGGDPPGMVLCGDHGGVVAAASAVAAAATSPCWVTTGSTGTGTSTTTDNCNKKHTHHLIQPCGSEGDVLDYTFEQTETFTCGEQSIPTGRETTMPTVQVPPACGSGSGNGGGGDDGHTKADGTRRRRGEHKELMGIETQRLGTVEPTPHRRRGILMKLSDAAAAAATASSSKRFSSNSSSRRRRTIKSKKSQDSVESSASSSSSSSSSEEIQLFFRPQRS